MVESRSAEGHPAFLASISLDREWLALMDDLSDYFYIKDRYGCFRFVNAAMARLFDSRTDLVLGKHDQDFVPGYLAARYAREDERVLCGKPLIRKVEMLSRDGLLFRWHITTKRPLRNRHGEIVGLTGLTRDLRRTRAPFRVPDELGKGVDFMVRHAGDPIRIDEVARLCNLSLSSFERRFRKTFGLTPVSFLRDVRLTRACRQLAETAEPISKVALDNGYCDQSYFSAEFARAFETSPSSYRKRLQNTDPSPQTRSS